MKNSPSSRIDRRTAMLATTGILVASVSRPGVVTAQQQEAEQKDLIFRTTDPRNGEPSLHKLVQSWITPTKHFYVRSHAPNPVLDAQSLQLKVEGLVRKPATLSLGQLAKYTRHQLTATLTCAGNRRSEFNAEGKVGGVQWEAGAIGNAKWGGVALHDVLKDLELLEGATHVWFEGLDQIKKGDGIIPFGGSVPIQKAMSMTPVPGTLLADTMNGKPLTADHGYPLRTLVPGYIGARSVKWLGKIVVSDRPSPNHYVATAYKTVKKTDAIDWAEAAPIYRFPINAAPCVPTPEVRLSPGNVELRGYALPTGRAGSGITQVLVSVDNGRTWTKAELEKDENDFCWQLWKANVEVSAKTTRIVVRALDSSGGFMPYRVPWNAKGYLQNSWYKMPVTVG